jgi:hypothetical protein
MNDSSNKSKFGIGTSTLIHIAAEIVVILGISYYFNKKILTLTENLDNMSKNFEQLKTITLQHHQILSQMTGGRLPPIKTEDDTNMIQHQHHQYQQPEPQQPEQQTRHPPYRTPYPHPESDSEDEIDQAQLDRELDQELDGYNDTEQREDEDDDLPSLPADNQEEIENRDGVHFVTNEDIKNLKRKKKKHKKVKRKKANN